MKKEELKKILKPLIKDCIKEVIFEEGTLSNIISEVVVGLNPQQTLQETRFPTPPQPKQKPRFESDLEAKSRREQMSKKLEQRSKSIMKSIGADAYNGVNLFEGTTPIQPSTGNQQGALSGMAPSDPGVDISRFSAASAVWKKLSGKQ